MIVLGFFCFLFATVSGQTNLTGLAVNGSGLYAWSSWSGRIDVRGVPTVTDPEVFSIAHDHWEAYIVSNNGASLQKVNTGNGAITSVAVVPGPLLSAAVCNGVYTAIIAGQDNVSIWSTSSGSRLIQGMNGAAVGVAACDETGNYWTYLESADGSSGLFTINPQDGSSQFQQNASNILALVGGAGPVLLAEADNRSVSISQVSDTFAPLSIVSLDASTGFVYSVASRVQNYMQYATSVSDNQTFLQPENTEFPSSLELLSLYYVPPDAATSNRPFSGSSQPQPGPNPSPSSPPSAFASNSIPGYPGNVISGFTWTNPTVLTFQGTVTLSGDLVVNLPSDFVLDGNTLVLFTFSDGTVINGNFDSVTVNGFSTSFCEPPTVEYGPSSVYLLFDAATDCAVAATFSLF